MPMEAQEQRHQASRERSSKRPLVVLVGLSRPRGLGTLHMVILSIGIIPGLPCWRKLIKDELWLGLEAQACRRAQGLLA